MHRIKGIMARELAGHLPVSQTVLEDWLEIPPDSAMGDLALPCFRLAKELRQAPQAIAKDLASRIAFSDLLQGAEAIGPYVNMRLRRNLAHSLWLQAIERDDAFFTSDSGKGRTVAIDLSSPNIAKPFGMGHLRSTIIGTALANLFESDGFTTLRINHIGDWGTQFGKIMVAYHRYGDPDQVRANPIQELNSLYVRFHEEEKTSPELEAEGRAAFKRLEDGEPEETALWQWIVDVSLEDFNRTFELLGTRFTHVLGESFYNDKMDAVVDELRAKGLLTRSEGAEVVSLEPLDLPPCLIRKSDGATLYATRDLAAALYRHKVLGANRLTYVVGGEQRLHFKQLFAVLERMGYEFAAQCSHVAFGMMTIGGKKMSTRKGHIVRLQDVLDEAISRAKTIIAQKSPDLTNAEEVAKAIGVGAVIFNDLKTNRLHDIEFAMDQAVAFDGETGPYVQYTHARACSVLRKAGLLDPGESNPAAVATWSELLANEWTDKTRGVASGEEPSSNKALDEALEEGLDGVSTGRAFDDATLDDVSWELAKQVSQFSGVRQRASAEADPSLIAKQVLDICQAFNRFYHDCPILTSQGSTRTLRLALTDATRLTIRASLQLLGIGHPAQL